MLARERLKRLWKVALTAPSHERVVLIHRSNGRTHPICGQRPLPDAPAGLILAPELGGPKRRIWGAIDSDLVAWGESGAGLTVARLGRGPSWPCTEHEGAKCRHPAAKSVEKNSWLTWIHGSRFLAFHGFPRSVMANTPLSDRPTVYSEGGDSVNC